MIKNSIKHKKDLLIILFGITITPFIVLGIIQIIKAPSKSVQEATPAPITYEIVKLPPEYELLWEISSEDIGRPQSKGSINLVAGDENAYLLNGLGDLVTINLLTNEPSFSTHSTKTGATTLAINENNLFIGFDGTQKISGDTEWGAGSIEAFDLSDRSQIWTQTIAGSRTLDTVVATNETVSTDGDFSSSYFLFDAQNGELLEKLDKNNRNFIWARDRQTSYERSLNASFLAVDRQSNAILWKSPFNYAVYQPPIFADSIIVVRIGEANDSGKVMGLDMATGDILWEYEASISNVAISNSTAFFINYKVELVAIDIETGNLKGTIIFTPNTRTFSFNDSFHVAANENIILAYLGEGEQLMSFSYQENNE